MLVGRARSVVGISARRAFLLGGLSLVIEARLSGRATRPRLPARLVDDKRAPDEIGQARDETSTIFIAQHLRRGDVPCDLDASGCFIHMLSTRTRRACCAHAEFGAWNRKAVVHAYCAVVLAVSSGRSCRHRSGRSQ